MGEGVRGRTSFRVREYYLSLIRHRDCATRDRGAAARLRAERWPLAHWAAGLFNRSEFRRVPPTTRPLFVVHPPNPKCLRSASVLSLLISKLRPHRVLSSFTSGLVTRGPFSSPTRQTSHPYAFESPSAEALTDLRFRSVPGLHD